LNDIYGQMKILPSIIQTMQPIFGESPNNAMVKVSTDCKSHNGLIYSL
jgi:hypothetical protein